MGDDDVDSDDGNDVGIIEACIFDTDFDGGDISF